MRAKAANEQFVAVAQQYGWLPQGAKAHYFAGITYEELGQNGQAETELKAAADAWDHNLANLAKLALAGLYHQTGATPRPSICTTPSLPSRQSPFRRQWRSWTLPTSMSPTASRTRRAPLGQGEGRG